MRLCECNNVVYPWITVPTNTGRGHGCQPLRNAILDLAPLCKVSFKAFWLVVQMCSNTTLTFKQFWRPTLLDHLSIRFNCYLLQLLKRSSAAIASSVRAAVNTPMFIDEHAKVARLKFIGEARHH